GVTVKLTGAAIVIAELRPAADVEAGLGSDPEPVDRQVVRHVVSAQQTERAAASAVPPHAVAARAVTAACVTTESIARELAARITGHVASLCAGLGSEAVNDVPGTARQVSAERLKEPGRRLRLSQVSMHHRRLSHRRSASDAKLHQHEDSCTDG